MPRRYNITVHAAADLYGIGKRTLQDYRAAGIDLIDEPAVRAEQRRRKRRQVGFTGDDPSDEVVAGITEARHRKVVAEALLAELRLEVAQGLKLDRGEVLESYGAAIAAFRAGLLALPGELPPLLEGMGVADIRPRLASAFDQLLEELERRLDGIVEPMTL